MTIRVAIVDDHSLVRAGFRLILESEEDLTVVGEGDDGGDVLALAERSNAHVVLMDVEMPRVNGITATRQLVESGLDVRVLIVTTFDRDDYVFDALAAGASGFVLKNAPPEQLVEAIRVVAAGDALLSPAVTRRVIESYVRSPPSLPPPELERLTERENEILRLLASGKSNAELAEELYVSEGTIKTHVSSVLTKLGLRDRVQAVVFAYEHGLVRPGGPQS